MHKLLLPCAILLLVAVAYGQTTPRSQAKVTSLPGLTFTPNFDQYAGYVNLAGTTKNIFYWFFTSQSADPTQDPVVLWLQGGPGCSSVGDGLFLEHGPFRVQPDFNKKTVNLTSDYYSWNRLANMIYIDSPCGVGYSYGTNVPADYKTNDNITAVDSYMFLQGFFDIYTEFAQNEFWVTGESYAGVYIPSLAYQILTNGSDSQLASNLKKGGLMLGNPVTNCNGASYSGNGNILNFNDQLNLFYWHGMVSRRDFDDWNSKGCNTGNPNNLLECYAIYSRVQHGIGHLDQPLQSAEAEDRRHRRIQPAGSVNPDMLYYSYCTGNGTLDFNTDLNPDCFNLDDQVSTYLNDPAVQSALHVAQPTKWTECTSKLAYHKLGVPAPNYLEQFFTIAPEMRIMYYSGDVDLATVPFSQTQRCLETMKRPIVQSWRPYTINKEVAGYVEIYDTYTYATVKGAGHEAPQFQPAASWLLFSTFLKNGTLPTVGI